MADLAELARRGSRSTGYRFAYLDESAKRDVRRALLKAICIPGHQVPFASREMPVARGWGSGGLQVTLATLVTQDVVKALRPGRRREHERDRDPRPRPAHDGRGDDHRRAPRR